MKRWTHCFYVNCNRDFGSRLTKSNTVKRVDVHNVRPLVKLCCGFVVDLRLPMDSVLLRALKL